MNGSEIGLVVVSIILLIICSIITHKSAKANEKVSRAKYARIPLAQRPAHYPIDNQASPIAWLACSLLIIVVVVAYVALFIR